VARRRRAQRVPPTRHQRQRQAALPARQLRHAHALELAREGVALNIMKRQLGRAELGTTSI
jgi:site-specific recombinase XerD